MMDGNAFCLHMHGPCILLIVGSPSNFLPSGAKVEQILPHFLIYIRDISVYKTPIYTPANTL
jgi:hypothetical protein